MCDSDMYDLADLNCPQQFYHCYYTHITVIGEAELPFSWNAVYCRATDNDKFPIHHFY